MGQRVEWGILDVGDERAITAPNSSLDIISNDYDTLDGIEGPFAVFVPYSGDTLSNYADIPALSLSAEKKQNKFSG